MNKQVLPEKIAVTCTDNDKVVEAYLDRYVEQSHMDVIVNTVRMRLNHKKADLYVGNMTGLEFTARAPEIVEIKPFRR
tara:strand:- start:110 stop:343 length:234 start_codon:yes stop_codon:yes gene_type:complete